MAATLTRGSVCFQQSDEREKQRREKQIQKKRKEYLVKELEGLLKHEGTDATRRSGSNPVLEADPRSVAAGSGDLIPVIGFFCQRCEEFFGDLSSAEGHEHTDKHQVNTARRRETPDPRPSPRSDSSLITDFFHVQVFWAKV